MKSRLIQILDGTWLYAVFFLIVLALCVNYATVGWSHSIGGPQDFRQTQTAIASFYIAEEGPKVATKIPVLGPVWRIPLEFPTYQSTVALIHRASGMPLDGSGRFVSLAFFILSLPILAWLFSLIGFSRTNILLCLALVAASPTYIFWSRSFLIESMAFFFAAIFAATLLAMTREPRRWHLPVVMIAGAFAVLTKFTTFSIFFGFCILVIGFQIVFRQPQRIELHRAQAMRLAAAFITPLLVAFAWTRYIDYHWALSPLVKGKSGAIHGWNFGSIEQRFDPAFWDRFHQYAIGYPMGSLVPLAVGFTLFLLATPKWRIIALSCLGAWLSGPLVWANLYFVHDYYYYATTAFIFAWFVASVQGVSERLPEMRRALTALPIALALWLLVYYPGTAYFEASKYDWGADKARFAKGLTEHIPEGDVIFIIGDDWNPMISYYSQRYSIMVRWENHTLGEDFREALEMTKAEGRRFAGVVVTTHNPLESDLDRILEWLVISDEPLVVSDDGRYRFYLTVSEGDLPPN